MIPMIDRSALRRVHRVIIDRHQTLLLNRRTYDAGHYDTHPADVQITYEGGYEIGVGSTIAAKVKVLIDVARWLFEDAP